MTDEERTKLDNQIEIEARKLLASMRSLTQIVGDMSETLAHELEHFYNKMHKGV